MRDLLSTYRVQLSRTFRLTDLRARIPYLSRLGVSHIYLSPILRARSGSPHGYDVVDPTELNPELGGEADLASLVEELRRHEMGAILDIVPNHMATGHENPFWEDVLQHGPSSRFAAWFDIDWGPDTARRPYRLLLPVLGDRLGRVIDAGELGLTYEHGRFRLAYHEQSFPIDPGTLPLVLDPRLDQEARRSAGEARGPLDELRGILDRLSALPPRTVRDPSVGAERAAAADVNLGRLRALARGERAVVEHVKRCVAAHARGTGNARRLRRLVAAQTYRLAYWRRAAREINYRRFFTISHLVAVRQEDPAVFAPTHQRVLDWVAAGWLDGLRIDHIDGLLQPGDYLERLRGEVAARLPEDRRDRFVVFVEKILARDEELPEDWAVSGTTGYDFLAEVEDLFIDADGFERVEAAYRRFVRRADRFEEVARRSRRGVLDGPLAGEARRLGRLLELATRDAPPGSAPDRADLTDAVVETLAEMSVYRTYFDRAGNTHRDRDMERLARAVEGARVRGRAAGKALNLLNDILSRETAWSPESRRFVQRFQQVSVSVAAKGVEDTALYIHVPLLSRNDVGGEPGAPLTESDAALHRSNARRRERWPAAQLAVTTHDTKRNADVRARIDVLSEFPELWERSIRRWHRWNRRHRTRLGWRYAPGPNTEYLLYQTLVGIWPAPTSGGHTAGEGSPTDGTDAALRERIQAYALKAVREAKTQTSWVNPHEDFERALETFVTKILSRETSHRFLADLEMLVGRVARPGLWNSLARTLIQLTAPGTPDIYQGDEVWTWALVDPDNRRPVDFALRERSLGDLPPGSGPADPDSIAAMLDSAEDGRLKLYLLSRALGMRRTAPELFRTGRYIQLRAAGGRERHVFAFARRHEDRHLIIVVPRFSATLAGGSGQAPMGAALWGDTRLLIPTELRAPRWRCALSGVMAERRAGRPDGLRLAEVLRALPVALLEPAAGGASTGGP